MGESAKSPRWTEASERAFSASQAAHDRKPSEAELDRLRSLAAEHATAAGHDEVDPSAIREAFRSLGAGGSSDLPPRATAASESRPRPSDVAIENPRSRPRPRLPRPCTLGLVVLPLLGLGVEIVTGICAACYADPVPTLLHVLALLSLPAAAGISRRALASRRPGTLAAAATAVTFAGPVAAWYALAFARAVPSALVGLLFFGAGLLLLTPYIACYGLLVLRRHLGDAGRAAGFRIPLGAKIRGLVASLALLAAMTLPPECVRELLERGTGPAAGPALSAVERARQWIPEERLLREWAGVPRLFGTDETFARIVGTPPTAEQIRALDFYWRVTGRVPVADLARLPDGFGFVPDSEPGDSTPHPPIPEVPPLVSPPLADSRRDDFRSDAGRGQGRHPAREPSLATSTMELSIDPDIGVATISWALEFRRRHEAHRESCRARLLLPEGGVLTHVVLAQDDGATPSPSEAGDSAWLVASRPMAVARALDDDFHELELRHLRVEEPGRVEIRLTAPLELTETEARLALPLLLDEDFALDPVFLHRISISSATTAPLIAASCAVRWRQGDGGRLVAGVGQEDALRLARPDALVLRRRAAGEAAVTVAPVGEGPSLRMSLVRKPGPSSAPRVLVVLDGGVAMARYARTLAAAVRALPSSRPVVVFVATDDGVRELDSGSLDHFPFAGGRDNAPALAAALDRAVSDGGSGAAIFWLGGAQPLVSADGRRLVERWNALPVPPPIHWLAVDRGPNQLAAGLASRREFRRVRDRCASLAESLSHALVPREGALAREWTIAESPNPVPPEWAGDAYSTLLAGAEVARLRREGNEGAAEALVTRLGFPAARASRTVLDDAASFRTYGIYRRTVVMPPVEGALLAIAMMAATLGLLVLLAVTRTHRG